MGHVQHSVHVNFDNSDSTHISLCIFVGDASRLQTLNCVYGRMTVNDAFEGMHKNAGVAFQSAIPEFARRN
jgi:hypothetical protein